MLVFCLKFVTGETRTPSTTGTTVGLVLNFVFGKGQIRGFAMAGDNSTHGNAKGPTVLGDVTNQVGKRGLSSLLGYSVLNPEIGCHENTGDEERGSRLGKRICLGAENMSENFRSKTFVVAGKENGLSPPKNKQPCVLPLSNGVTVAVMPNEIKQSGGLIPVRSDYMFHGVTELNNVPRERSSSSSVMLAEAEISYKDACVDVCKGQDDDRGVSDVAHGNTACKALLSHAHTSGNNSKGLGVDVLDSGFVECSGMAWSQGSKQFVLERCTGQKADGSLNLSSGVESLKACSCSFCTKAAFIWSDLHYQDIKGRTSVLRKSQKEASNLVQRNCWNKDTGLHGPENVNKSSNLESDLMGHWRSLFLHMEDVYVRESTQLEANFMALKDLRERCKMDLEFISGLPRDEQYASESSGD